MSVLTVYSASGSGGATCDGWLRHRAATWATAHSGNAGTVDVVSAYIYVSADNNYNGQFTCNRGYCTFNTSAIGESSTISAATLSLTLQGNLGNSYINIFASTQASAGTLATTDFSAVGSTAFSTATATGSMTLNVYTDYILNASGITNISKTGMSKFSIREINHDVNNVAPENEDDWWGAQLQSADSGTLAPRLVVTYSGVSSGGPFPFFKYAMAGNMAGGMSC